MQPQIVAFRQGRHSQTGNQMIVSLPGVDTRENASKYVGKSVVFTTPGGKKITGKIASAHGNSGKVRVLFEQGMPGQSLFKQIDIQ